jgi:hypothetical protein
MTSTAPVELRLAAGLLTGSALVFVLVAFGRMLAEGGGGWLELPLLQLAVALGVSGGVLTGFRLARVVGIAVALAGALLHMVLALQPAPWWARLVSGLLAIAQIYAAVLLNTRPAVEFTHGARH